MAQQGHTTAEQEAAFRKESLWLSFKTSLYTALSTATFFGVVGKMVMSAVDAFGSGEPARMAVDSFQSPASLAIMGAAIVAGIAFTYMAQKEWTDLSYIRDEHHAKRTAECMGKSPEQTQTVQKDKTPEYEQNCRADGQPWGEVCKQRQQASHATAI